MALTVLLLAVLQAPPEALPADAFPLIEEFPDPFRFQDGHRVRTQEDWRQRRAEMLELILRYEYGHVPPPPDNIRVEEELSSEVTGQPAMLHQILRLSMGPENTLTTTLHLRIPQSGTGPYPVIVRFGIDDACVSEMIGRGYAYACFDQHALEPDTEGHDVIGPAQAAYPGYDWASLAVWAWGACRVLDCLETRPEIDAKQAIITGHSRTGKAALLAGALDERFALVVPNGSGCGGASAYRGAGKGVETLELITLPSRFKSWFQADFGRFADQESRLPFDQHFLRALVAPRPIVSTDALGDTWCNPPGTQAAWMAAQPVFDFLGVRENNRSHFREGQHDQLPADYAVLLDAADHYLGGKPLTRDFSTLPEPGMKPGWSWAAPAPPQ